jgi:DNA-binding XRE family transcriptional regulator
MRDNMCDALVHANAMAEYRAGGDEGMTLELTHTTLAKAAKTTQPPIVDLESRKHGGSLEVMARIAKALKIKLDDLAAAD